MPKNTEIKTAMILAAGFGTRMEDLCKTVPKPLLPLGNLTLIDVIVNKLKNAGIQKVVINIHFEKEKILRHFREFQFPGLDICFSEEKELLGTGGGIAKAMSFFGNETILLMNSDILSDILLKNFMDFHFRKRATASMVVVPSRNYHEYSLVRYSTNQQVVGFLPKEKMPQTKSTGIFTGIQILSPEARKYLLTEPSSVIKTFYLPAIRDGKRIFAYLHQGEWIDLGEKSRYLEFVKSNKNLENYF